MHAKGGEKKSVEYLNRTYNCVIKLCTQGSLGFKTVDDHELQEILKRQKFSTDTSQSLWGGEGGSSNRLPPSLATPLIQSPMSRNQSYPQRLLPHKSC